MWQHQFHPNAFPTTTKNTTFPTQNESMPNISETTTKTTTPSSSATAAAATTSSVNEHKQGWRNRSLLLSSSSTSSTASLSSTSMSENWQFANLTSKQIPEMPMSSLLLPHTMEYSATPAETTLVRALTTSGRTTKKTTTTTGPISDLLLPISKPLLAYLPSGICNMYYPPSTTATTGPTSSLCSPSTMSTSFDAATTAAPTYGIRDYPSIDLLTDIFMRLNASLLHYGNINGISGINATHRHLYDYLNSTRQSSTDFSPMPYPTTTSMSHFFQSTPPTSIVELYPPITTASPAIEKPNGRHIPIQHETDSEKHKEEDYQHQHKQHRHHHRNHHHCRYHQHNYPSISYNGGSTIPSHQRYSTFFDGIVDAEMSRKSHESTQSSRQTAELFEQIKCCRKSKAAVDATDVDLLPPPKKKWIRHYLKEDECSSSIAIPSKTKIPVDSQTKNSAFFLLASTNADNQTQHEQHKQQQPQLQQQQYEIQNDCKKLFYSINELKPYKKSENDHFGYYQNYFHGKHSMPLNIPTISEKQPILVSKLVKQQIEKNVSSTSSPSTFLLDGVESRYKTNIPLTPPPNASRKISESRSRIRSYSMSSHKIPANQWQLHNGASNSSSNSSHMIIDDNTPSHLGIGNNHSPPRRSGSHYMQLQHQGSQGSSPFGSTVRRRTISSNSNGAGTREVHNKLEKNRRAHLKECYDQLKSELQLNDEERSKKTSNLAVLNEALATVKSLQDQEKSDELSMEKLGKEKILLNKRFSQLKKELYQKPEQISITFPDGEFNNIPPERDNAQESASLCRGSTLYSSSSSLSSGGSSNIMFSPVGAGQIQTAIPTAISPVITKINNNNANSTTASATTTNITNVHQHHHHNHQHNNNNHNNANSNSISTVSLTDSPNGLPLALAATTITRGSPTPSTPSPSPSSSSGISSSSSLISSSPPMGGVISNGRSVTVNIPFQTTSGGATIGTIGNGTASAAATIIATSPSGQSHAVKTNNVLPPMYDRSYDKTQKSGRSNEKINNNNYYNYYYNNFYNTFCTQFQQDQLNFVSSAVHVVASTNANNHATTNASINNHSNNNINNNNNNPNSNHNKNNNLSNGYRNKRTLSIGDETKTTTKITTFNGYETDVIQQPPTKIIKVYNGLGEATTTGGNNGTSKQTTPSTAFNNHHTHAHNNNSNNNNNNTNNNNSSYTTNANGSLQLSPVVGGGSLVVKPKFINAITTTSGGCGTIRTQKILMNGQNAANVTNGKSIVINGNSNTKTTNELARLPGGAELNILPSSTTTTGIVNGNCGGGGIKLNNSTTAATTTAPLSSSSTTMTTTAFYHANGKLTLVNGVNAAAVGINGNNGILLKENNNTVGCGNAALTPIIVSTTTNGSVNGGMHNTTSASFAQLLAASSVAGQAQNFVAAKTMAPTERLNGKFSLLVGGQALPRISAQYLSTVKPMIVTVTTPTTVSAPTTCSTMAIEATNSNSTILTVATKNSRNNNINNNNNNNNNSITTTSTSMGTTLTQFNPITSNIRATATTTTSTARTSKTMPTRSHIVAGATNISSKTTMSTGRRRPTTTTTLTTYNSTEK